MAGWNSAWDTEQIVKVEVAPGDVRELSVEAVATYDTPDSFSLELLLPLAELGPGFEERGLVLWSNTGTLDPEELTFSTVRNMDDSDVYDRLGGTERGEPVLDGTLLSFEAFKQKFEEQEEIPLPPIQARLPIQSQFPTHESTQSLINKLTE